MPDITMCSGDGCPLKEHCYRFKAIPNTYQSYFMTPPVREGECEYYWKIKIKNEDHQSISKNDIARSGELPNN